MCHHLFLKHFIMEWSTKHDSKCHIFREMSGQLRAQSYPNSIYVLVRRNGPDVKIIWYLKCTNDAGRGTDCGPANVAFTGAKLCYYPGCIILIDLFHWLLYFRVVFACACTGSCLQQFLIQEINSQSFTDNAAVTLFRGEISSVVS